MKKNLLNFCMLVLIQVAGFPSIAQNIFSGEPVQVVGSFNGYTTTPYGSDYRTTSFRRVSVNTGIPTDGRGQWATTINVQATGGDVTPINMAGGGGTGFLFISGPIANRFQNKWVFTGVGQATIDAINGISAFNAGNDMGLNMSTAGYYSFIFNDCGYTQTNGSYYIAYTTANPVNLSVFSQVINPDRSANIVVNTNVAPSASEKIYIRYTLGLDFAGTGTSSIIEATGTGTSYTATIPSQSLGVVVRYYAFSSTRTLAQISAGTESDRSLVALRYEDNGGANYVYNTSVLPVKITSFSAKQTGKSVALQWNTESEYNLHRYELLRSFNGNDFDLIATVSAKNSAGSNNYSAIDLPPTNSTVYYKIAGIELDGRKTISNTIRLNIAPLKQILSIHPNPVKDFIHINLPNMNTGKYYLTILTADGVKVTEQSFDFTGINKLDLPVPVNAKPGLYIIQIKSSTQPVLKTSFILQ